MVAMQQRHLAGAKARYLLEGRILSLPKQQPGPKISNSKLRGPNLWVLDSRCVKKKVSFSKCIL